jgi:hypothetical protein
MFNKNFEVQRDLLSSQKQGIVLMSPITHFHFGSTQALHRVKRLLDFAEDQLRFLLCLIGQLLACMHSQNRIH